MNVFIIIVNKSTRGERNMPKVIHGLRERILEEARRLAEEQGYAGMNIREVARRCGIGVGTVYNYYPSKEYLTAEFILAEWQPLIASLKEDREKDLAEQCRRVLEGLTGFRRSFDWLFSQPEVLVGAAESFHRYRPLLVTQVAECIEGLFREEEPFVSRAIASLLLEYSDRPEDGDRLLRLIGRLFADSST